MKLAFVADGRSPIAQGWISLFVERGHEVHLLSSFRCAPLPGLASLHFISVAFSGMDKHREKSEFRALGGARGIGLRSMMRHWLGPFTLPRAGAHVHKILERLGVDLVHALRIPFEGMAAAGAPLGLPLVASVWGNDFTLHAHASPGMNYHTRRTMSRVDGLHTDCKRDIRMAAEWGFGKDRPTVVLPGGGGIMRGLFRPALPAMESFRPEVREQLEGLPAWSPIVVNPRGFRAYVRNDTFFRSIPGVLERVPGTKFLCPAMAGEKAAERWIENLNIEGSVLLLPKLTQEEMAMVYRMSAVMVSPSEHDGTPNTFLEAMACGCFPVVGDLESLQEWVAAGDNGFLVNPDDPADLAQATARALMDAELRQRADTINQSLIDERADRGRVAVSAEQFYMNVITRVKADGWAAGGKPGDMHDER